MGTRRLQAFWPVLLLVLVRPDGNLNSQDLAVTRYSPEVVARAEAVLQEAGLRHSGKTLVVVDAALVHRGLTQLTNTKRALRTAQQEHAAAVAEMEGLRWQHDKLLKQQYDLNLQLARVTDTLSNNRIVGALNAITAQIKELEAQRQQQTAVLSNRRKAFKTSEADYAELVLATRSSYDKLRSQLDDRLQDAQVQIAVRVLHVNAGTPAEVTAATLLDPLERRIGKLEAEITIDKLPLQAVGGALFVEVWIGNKSVPMVVDSGASIVTLPQQQATDLGVVVPPEAREVRLLTADGREIGARAVTIPKMRVGNFQATNVAAVVMQANAAGAQPLLGMSFLEQFKFELDAQQRTLKLLKVSLD